MRVDKERSKCPPTMPSCNLSRPNNPSPARTHAEVVARQRRQRCAQRGGVNPNGTGAGTAGRLLRLKLQVGRGWRQRKVLQVSVVSVKNEQAEELNTQRLQVQTCRRAAVDTN